MTPGEQRGWDAAGMVAPTTRAEAEAAARILCAEPDDETWRAA